MYKLRDGPIDWWFCNDDHALEWLDHRHKTPAINDMLRMLPSARNLHGKTIEQWVRDELSHHRCVNTHALSERCDRVDGVCDVDSVQVPVRANTELPPA